LPVASRRHDLVLRRGGTAGQIDDLGACDFIALGAGAFEAAHAFDHQRRDGNQRDDDLRRA